MVLAPSRENGRREFVMAFSSPMDAEGRSVMGC